MRPSWQIQIIRLDPTTLKILCEEFKLQSCSMWNFLHYPIISFNSFHNILLCVLFLIIINSRSSLKQDTDLHAHKEEQLGPILLSIFKVG
jgi:hypothetical protein